MSVDWVLVILALVFIVFSESLKEMASRETKKIQKLFLNSFAKFIEYCVIGAFVALLFKYYKLV